MASEIEYKICREQAVYFRSKLRAARDAALHDSEGYQQVLFGVEQFGRQMWPMPRPAGLGQLQCRFRQFLSICFESESPFHAEFDSLYSMMVDGRNDAMHVGAVARRLTVSCVRIAIMLEDALMATSMKNELTIQHYMVYPVVRTYEWQPIGLIRQTMLESSFSYLPFRQDDEWRFVSADTICRYLQHKCRRYRLTMTLSQAVSDGLKTRGAKKVCPEASVRCVLNKICGDEPVLVIRDETNDLIGIANSFDLM